MTVLGTTCPYYGGKQVANPANVIPTTGAPSPNITALNGTLAVDNAAQVIYGAASQVGGVIKWVVLGGTSAAVNSVTGTANQILATPTTGAVALSLVGPYTPTTYTAHGVLVGEGTGSIVALGVGATGTVLAGTSAADPAFTATPTVTSLTATGDVKGASITASGDAGGAASTIRLSNVNSAVISTGAGSIAMSTANPATNTAWLKLYIGTSAFWIPAWTTNAP
jgi:hypothetical protein